MMVERKPLSLSFRVILINDLGQCLLLRRADNQSEQSGKWDFPGGKLEPYEDFNDAIIRETEEETGLKVTIERVAGVAEFELDAVRVICVIFVGKAASQNIKLSEEHDMFKWIDINDVKTDELAVWFHGFWRSFIKNSVESQ